MKEENAQHSAHEHSPHLAHHFDTSLQQFDSGKLGMWIFLATEILLFGGLFCAYAVYRANHPEIFIYAHQYLDKTLGGINTVVLICSSLTMAWAVRCAQTNQQRGLVILLALTLLGGCGFLSIKYVEYQHKWKHGLLWGKRFHPTVEPGEEEKHQAPVPPAASVPVPAPTLLQPSPQPATAPADTTKAPTMAAAPAPALDEHSKIAPAAIGPTGLARYVREKGEHGEERDRPSNVQIFFGIYFAMTGLHGLHVIAGMSVITWLLARSVRGDFSSAYFTPVDLGGLYWHLVDLIWIYLFPLLYLIH